jgi:hypothetical protein
MRVMDVPPFPRKMEIPDLENVIRSRLSNAEMVSPHHAIPLVGYMCWPNDEVARADLQGTLWSWLDTSQGIPPDVPAGLGRLQFNWQRVADIFHVYCDLVDGRHQERRGGPSIGKAVELVEAKAKSWGTGASNLWKLWGIYKDVAPVVTAATLICFEARRRYYARPLGPFGLSATQIIPLQMPLLMPDFVLAVAMEFERYGLRTASKAHAKSALDLDTLWRIPADINVVPITPPTRPLGRQDIVILNNRRAGNRGRARQRAHNSKQSD